MKVFELGGQEIVTATLAKCFTEHNHNLCIVSFKPPKEIMINRTDKKINVYSIGNYKYSKKNVEALREILIKNEIQIVINQWGLPYISAKVLNKAKQGLNVKVIAIYHNDPGTNARIKDVEIELSKTRCGLDRLRLIAKKSLFKFITSNSMRYVYRHSDIYQVLSPSFVERFKIFTGIKNPQKLMVQTNPVTIDAKDFLFRADDKENEIIYVGRIDYNQKRVYRVVDTWALLEKKYPNWHLTIVGDGIERHNIENKVRALGLKNVSFEGFKSPIDYYKRAKILMLTSEYEGFPLVLAECMEFGVVPVVYGSYSAVYDIIEDGINGIIIPYNKFGYPEKFAAKRMEKLMVKNEIYEQMAINAIHTSKNYSIDEIYKSWEKTFKELLG